MTELILVLLFLSSSCSTPLNNGVGILIRRYGHCAFEIVIFERIISAVSVNNAEIIKSRIRVWFVCEFYQRLMN